MVMPVGDLLGDLIVGAVAIKMIDSADNHRNNNNNNNNQNQQQEQPKRKKTTTTTTTTKETTTNRKKTSHGSRALLQPRTDGDKPF